jgi:hypothetical protein
MHSDGGGEYINKNLDKFLKGKGVKQTVSAPHTSGTTESQRGC